MLCLEIELNGERYCLAGLDEGVVSAFVSHVGLRPEGDLKLARERRPTLLTVNGFTREQQAVHWRDQARELRVGDEVRIRVVDVASPDTGTVTPQLEPLPGEE